jgi:hypothetical protein
VRAVFEVRMEHAPSAQEALHVLGLHVQRHL